MEQPSSAPFPPRLGSEGKRIGDFDEVIAAIALCRDREIMTEDLRFREVAGLVVMGWRMGGLSKMS